MKHDCAEGSTQKKKVKRPKLSIGHVLQIVEHTQSIIDSQSISQSYTELKEKEIKQGKMKDTQSPQLISALDKDTQLIKIAVIQPPKSGDMQMKRSLNSNLIWANLVWLIKLICLNKSVR